MNIRKIEQRQLYVCVSVCVCVCEREREREREKLLNFLCIIDECLSLWRRVVHYG